MEDRGFSRRGWGRWVPLAVSAVGLLATAIVSMQLLRNIQERERVRFENSVQRREDAISDRISTYIAMLRAGVGFFMGSAKVEREEFHQFVDQLRLADTFPGVQGVGFSRRLSPAEVPQFVQGQRKSGVQDFRVWPEYERDEYHTIVYLAPMDPRNKAALGYDMFSDETRRSAMERARDTGQPAASGRVILVQEIDEQKQPGFLIYAPVYTGGVVPTTVEERRAKLIGFVYSPFRAGDLFARIWGSEPHPPVGAAIYDGETVSEDHLLYQTGIPSGNRSNRQTRTLEVAGRRWTISFYETPVLGNVSNRGVVPLVATAGIIATLLLAALTWIQETGRRAAELADRRAAEDAMVLDTINRIGRSLAGELEMQKLVQAITDAGTQVTGAAFGAFFYNVLDGAGGSYMLYTVSGVPREHFSKFPMPRNTSVFAPTFQGLGTVRSDDITKDPRYAQNAPHRGMPHGHLPVKSYLAVSVVSRSGEVIGGLFFGHPEPDRFKEQHERIVEGIAAQAAISIDNGRLVERLRESENRARRLFEVSTVGTAVARLDGQITHTNEAFSQITGYGSNELALRKVQWTDLTPLEHMERERRAVEEVRNEGLCAPYETEYIRRNGTRVPVLVSRARLATERDEVVAFVVDLTKTKQAEAEAEEQRHLLRAVTDNAMAALFIVNERQECVFMNPAAEALTGHSLHEMRGRVLHDVVHHTRPDGTHYPLDECPISRSFLENRRLQGEEVFVHKNGTHYPVAYTASPMANGGRIQGTIIEMREIRREKEAEAEREKLLERERVAREEAERASRLKDEFLATLSHELRTPLNAIVGWSQILSRRGMEDPETLRAGLEVIVRNAQMQTQLIEDLLDMSRIISGKIRLDVQRVDLVAIIDAAIDTVRPMADAKDVQIERALDGRGDTLVRGDEARLQQVVWNLLANAVKFTSSGGTVRVALERLNGHVQVVVSDTGQGIAPQFLPHVFDRFRQADASTTRRHGGLGLGLAIVKHLVELHGGRVTAGSPGEGKGATFTVELPLTHGEDDLLEKQRRPARRPEAVEPARATTELDGVRVLVVDDEPDAREVVRRILADCHASVVAVGSVEEALRALDAGPFDVLVSDIGMPRRDGYDLIREVRAREGRSGKKLPAMALTAFARAEDQRRVTLEGFDVHVAKPIEPAELTAVVASLAGRVGEAT